MNFENPFDQSPAIERIQVEDVEYRVGDRVRICPADDMDIFDIALRGKIARIASIEQDFEDRVHLALTVDDDPGQDLGQKGLPGHRFFFRPADVVPLENAEEDRR
jgi:hypothetical protein